MIGDRPDFLRKFDKYREDERGWLGTCPQHASEGFSVIVYELPSQGRYGMQCVEAEGNDVCASEGRLLELLGITQDELRLPSSVGEVLATQRLSEVEMRSIVFVDRPFLQADAFHLCAGRKGVGKGTYVANIAARITRGELGTKRIVIWIASEDSAAIDIKPRVVAAGGDPERIVTVTEWIQLPRDVAKLGNTIASIGNVGLVVIDPVGNHITGKNSNSETDIRDAIAPLNGLADDHATIIFGVRHLSEKEIKAGAIAAILGSSAWVQVPRAVLVVARDNDDARVSHVQCVAGNRLPPDTPGRAFRIVGVTIEGLENQVTRTHWIGDSTKDVGSLLEQQAGKKTSRSDVARELVLDTLEAAPAMQMESDALDAAVAAGAGISAKTVKNLRTELRESGLLKFVPERDEFGAIERWIVARTRAPRQIPTSEDTSFEPDPDFSASANQNGSTTPDPVHIPYPQESGCSDPGPEILSGDLARRLWLDELVREEEHA